jgi:hypothetical protein
MKRTIVIACLALVGCQATQDGMRRSFGKVFKPDYSIEHFEAQCADAPFPSLGGCLRTKLSSDNRAWQSARNGDLAGVYVAWLEAAGAHVADGSMSEPDARLGMALLKSRWRDIESQRKTNTAVTNAAQMQSALAGLALMNSAQPPPSTPIVCNTTSLGGVTQTRCN